MGKTVPIALVFLLIVLIAAFLLSRQQSIGSDYLCQGRSVDMTKMLQYDEQLNGIKLKDRNGRLFELDLYAGKAMLLVFVKDNLKNIHAYNDSLHSYLGDYFKSNLALVFISRDSLGLASCNRGYPGLDLYCETDSLLINKSFKIHNHGSCVLLSNKHRVRLATLSVLFPKEVARIVEYKRDAIFMDSQAKED